MTCDHELPALDPIHLFHVMEAKGCLGVVVPQSFVNTLGTSRGQVAALVAILWDPPRLDY
jgi:hypothetical protein